MDKFRQVEKHLADLIVSINNPVSNTAMGQQRDDRLFKKDIADASSRISQTLFGLISEPSGNISLPW